MKKAAIFAIAAILLVVGLPMFAAQFPDVPADHWAYEAVQDLADQGIIVGYPDGTFSGKRALTRYEFAQALERAIPVIAEMAGGGGVGPAGPPGPPGPVGPMGPAGNAADIDKLTKLVNEFKSELDALGVDVEGLMKDLAALSDRVAALEAEQARVVFKGEFYAIGRGEVNNEGDTFDKDSREIGLNGDKVLQNSSWLNDYEFMVKGRVSDKATVNATLAAGNYLDFALGRAGAAAGLSDITLWNLNLNAAVGMGPLGGAQIVAGRFPFQLTPLTLKFVDPDSYTYVSKTDSGDYVLDGGSIAFNFGKANLTAFAAKAGVIPGLNAPNLLLDTNIVTGEPVSQIGGARLNFDAGNIGIGLTYYQTGLAIGSGRAEIFGADIDTAFSGIGIKAEYAKSKPNDTMTFATGVDDTKDNAWNAMLTWKGGNLGVGAGYGVVEENYFAPGSWSRLGEATNLVNVKGPMANLTYALTNSISITADGKFLEPDEDAADIGFRTATSQGKGFFGLDKVTGWKAGLKYALTSSNSVDLGYEEVRWDPANAAASAAKERYISLGVGHTFNSNASLKLLYQIVEYDASTVGGVASAVDNPYGDIADFRGGVATAEFAVKY